MTKTRVWKYCCDFCGKRGLSCGHMRQHELSCTANPNRHCRMHKHFSQTQPPMAEMLVVLAPSLPDRGIAQLRKLTANCPMCILAAIRQSGLQKFDANREPIDFHFEFKEELAEAWQRINAATVEIECEELRREICSGL